MKKTFVLSLFLASFLACGSSKPAPNVPEAASTVTLVIEEAKVVFPAPEDNSDTEHTIELKATGEAFMDGAHVGTLKSDGTVLDAQGEVVGQITKEGSLTFAGEDEVLISEDGTISIDGATMSFFQEDGTFRLPTTGHVGSYDGSPGVRRAIVVVYATIMKTKKEE